MIYSLTYRYAFSIEGHCSTLALQHVPECLREFNSKKMSVRPNLDAYVFLKAKKDAQGVFIDDPTEQGR